MELSFPWPLSQGEWLAWGSAALTALFGLVLLFAPRLALRMLRLRTADRHPEAVAAVRATMSGFYLGLGVSALLLAQPFLYLALGFSWGVTAFGRIISMLSDRGGGFYNLGFLVLEIALAALPLGFALGLLP
jgi:hypothetical protein